MQKNRKTVEIPIGHSSAWKQRAQNFFSKKKNQKSETGKFYIIILLLDGCAVELWAFYNLATIRQNMLLLLSFTGSSSTYEEFYKYRKEMEKKYEKSWTCFFLCYFCGLCERCGSKVNAFCTQVFSRWTEEKP